MGLSFRRWRPRHLLLAWSGYWLGLLLATFGEPLLLAWRMSRSPDTHGSVSAGFENSTGTLSIVMDGATAWSGSASLPTIVLWLAGPPLLLWLLWLRRSRASETDGPATGRAPRADATPHALAAPRPPDLDPPRPRPTPVPLERDR